jgi:membrane protease YdiL (CAAX protease family)
MKNKVLNSIYILIIFLVLNYLRYFNAYVFLGINQWNELSILNRTLLILIPKIFFVLLTTFIITKKNPVIVLGLAHGFKKGLFYGFLFSVPMFMGYAFFSSFNPNFGFKDVFDNMISAGFGEEFFYRAFLFGLLFYYCGWGFIPASCIASVFFAAGHLYQAHDFASSLSVFIFTSLASVGFALFYVFWKSLWMPVFLHGFMDLSWSMFSMEGDVTGNTIANIFRFSTIGLAIYLTIKKAKKTKFAELSGKWWVNTSHAHQPLI